MDKKDETPETPDIHIEDDNQGNTLDITDSTADVQLSPTETNAEVASVEAQSVDGADEKIEQIEQTPAPVLPVKQPGKLRRFIGTKKGKLTAALLGLVVILAGLLSVPFTRYALAGYVIKKDVAVRVIDAQTKKPVTEANVVLGTVSGKTDNEGSATLSQVPVGEYRLTITKKYYEDTTTEYIVPVIAEPQSVTTELAATGRQVTLSVTDKISGKPVTDATVTASDTSATTDADGTAVIVLPADKDVVTGIVKHSGYNDVSVELKVTEDVTANTVSATPAGTLYYLTKKTGKINVAKANLDGSDEKVVVEGTDKEDDHNTVLIASRDWKYLALLSRRDGGEKPKLFVINTANGEMKVADEGKADFSLIGWSGRHFAYTVDRQRANFWDDKGQALKSYDAEASKLTTIDETSGSGTGSHDYAHQRLSYVRVVGERIVYSKDWNLSQSYQYNGQLADKKGQLLSVKVGTADKKVVKEFDPVMYGYLEVASYRPDELYLKWSTEGKESFYSYADGEVKDAPSLTTTAFYDITNRNYFGSPNGTKTYWSEVRNGKNVHLVGDANGENGKEVLTSADYAPYGWFTDNYLLVSKAGSELFIAPADKVFTESETPLRVTDYHKPIVNFPGFGYGYGGN